MNRRTFAGRANLRALVACSVINLLDGFDILAMAFAAPSLMLDWHLADPRQLARCSGRRCAD